MMATGPEHYREAERILALIDDHRMDGGVRDGLAHAQVHATLALAAATALNDAFEGMPLSDHHEWRKAAATAEQRSDAEILAEQRSIFGEPVEGRDYHAMPGTSTESGDAGGDRAAIFADVMFDESEAGQ